MNTKVMIFLLFLIIAGAMVGTWWVLNYQDFLEKKRDKEEKIEQLKKAIANAGKVAAELEQKKKALAEAQAEYEKLKKKIQTKANIPEILRKTELAAIEKKVKFNEIRIDQMVPYEGYWEIPIELQIVGPYHDIGRFLRRLEFLKLFNVNAGTIQLQPYVGRSAGKSTEINMLLNVKSYILSDTGVGASFTAGTAGGGTGKK